MPFRFNPFTGNLDDTTIPDPLIVDNLTVNSLLQASHIHGNLAGSVYIHVKNADTVPLAKGTPFYVSGTVGASGRVEIKRANNLDPNSAPAIGLVENALEVNGEGNGVIIGEIFNYDTDTPGWDTNDPLYVGENGAITNVEPTSGYRQIVGYVGRVNQSSGTIIVTCNRQDPVAGSNTEIQFNDNGGFGSSTDLTWDDTGKVLGVGGDIDLDDGGTYSTTLQVITPTANRTISFPDATGTVALVAGSSGQLIYNNAGANAGTPTLTYDGSILTSSGRFINSYNATASSPAKAFTGTWFTGGTATTTKPHVLIEPSGTTSTAWDTRGTGLGVNAPSGFPGNLLDLQVNGTSNFAVDSTGRVSFPLGAAATPSLYPGTNTNTGIYSPGADTLALSTGGNERARIDHLGRVGIGTSSPDVNLHLGITPAGAGSAGVIGFGDISGYRFAEIEGVRIDGSFAGALVFRTQPAPGDGPSGTERARITNDGYLRLASGTGGIQFNGDTAAANALDDYEEGTFTPTVTAGITSPTYNTGSTIGIYRIIGKQVFFTLRIALAGGTADGNLLRIGGLPVNINSGGFYRCIFAGQFQNGASNTDVHAIGYASATYMDIYDCSDRTTVTGIEATNAMDLQITGSYPTL